MPLFTAAPLPLRGQVREKEPTEYNGWETYVAEPMEAKDTSFMPRNNALVLQAFNLPGALRPPSSLFIFFDL